MQTAVLGRKGWVQGSAVSLGIVTFLSTVKNQRQATKTASETAHLGPNRNRLCNGYFKDAVATWLVNLHLSNVHVELLPPNYNSILQPLDFRIIKNVKVHYRGQLLQCIIMNLRMDRLIPVNARQAVEMLTGAWLSVNASAIVKWWQKVSLNSASLAAAESPQEHLWRHHWNVEFGMQNLGVNGCGASAHFPLCVCIWDVSVKADQDL